VAEAGYAILPGGDGEFGLAVAPGWQGWRLGSRLLDTLIAAAAARGIPNLQADILLVNARMLALLSRRGYVTLGRYEFSEMRVASRPPSSPGTPDEKFLVLLPAARLARAAARACIPRHEPGGARAVAFAHRLLQPPSDDQLLRLSVNWRPYRTWVRLLLRTGWKTRPARSSAGRTWF